MHSVYPASCDVRRDFDMCASLALSSGHKTVFLRYDPDSFWFDAKNPLYRPRSGNVA